MEQTTRDEISHYSQNLSFFESLDTTLACTYIPISNHGDDWDSSCDEASAELGVLLNTFPPPPSGGRSVLLAKANGIVRALYATATQTGKNVTTNDLNVDIVMHTIVFCILEESAQKRDPFSDINGLTLIHDMVNLKRFADDAKQIRNSKTDSYFRLRDCGHLLVDGSNVRRVLCRSPSFTAMLELVNDVLSTVSADGEIYCSAELEKLMEHMVTSFIFIGELKQKPAFMSLQGSTLLAIESLLFGWTDYLLPEPED